jgi:hypothetical protein
MGYSPDDWALIPSNGNSIGDVTQSVRQLTKRSLVYFKPKQSTTKIQLHRWKMAATMHTRNSVE